MSGTTAMPFPERILTERLLLRVPLATDAEEIFARYGRDPEVCRYMSWRPHESVRDTVAFLERAIANRASGTQWGWLIYPRPSGPLLGSIGCEIEGPRIQFGYCFARDAWDHGYATETARAFVKAALASDEIWRVQAYCDLENPASARVLEKAGLTLEGTLRRYVVLPNLGDVPRDVYLYAKVRDPE